MQAVAEEQDAKFPGAKEVRAVAAPVGKAFPEMRFLPLQGLAALEVGAVEVLELGRRELLELEETGAQVS
jgi:hypothetical protein